MKLERESTTSEQAGMPAVTRQRAGLRKQRKHHIGKMLLLAAICLAPVIGGSADDPVAAATNAAAPMAAGMTNMTAATTNAPAPAQQPDSVAYPPGANAGNEQD